MSNSKWIQILNNKNKTSPFLSQKKKQLHNDPSLKFDGSEIPLVDKYKFLGIIFDKKLTFISHVKYQKTKCNITLQLLRVVAHKEWEDDWKTLLLLYRSLIRSQLDYNNFIYQSTRKSYVKILDPIYHRGLRLVLGAFRTSPAESLYAEANEAPENIRRTNWPSSTTSNWSRQKYIRKPYQIFHLGP